MANAIRYYAEATGLNGETWRVNVHDAQYNGTTPIPFTLAGEVFRVEWTGEDEDTATPVVGSTATVYMLEENGNHTLLLTNLATSVEGRYTVTIRRDPDGVNTLWWAGVVLPDQTTQTDAPYPRIVEFTATDEVGNLETVEYTNNGELYTGSTSVLQHLVLALGKLRNVYPWGPGVPFLRYANWIEPTNIGTGLDTLANVYLSHETWTETEEDGTKTPMAARTVLESLARAFNARIYLAGGVWWFMPVGAVANNTTVTYVDVDTAADEVGTGTMELAVDPSAQFYRLAGGEFSYLPPIGTVTREYKYRGNVPPIVRYQQTNYGDLPLTMLDADRDYIEDTTVQLRVFNWRGGVTQAAATGANRIGRLVLYATIKCGSYYYTRAVTTTTTTFYLADEDTTVQYAGHVYGPAAWSTTPGTFAVVSPLMDRAHNGFGSGAGLANPFGFNGPEDTRATFRVNTEVVTGPLPATSIGMEITVEVRQMNNAGTITALDGNVNTAVPFATYIDARTSDNTNNEIIRYTGYGEDTSRVNVDQGTVMVGDRVSGNHAGVLRVNEGAGVDDATGWATPNVGPFSLHRTCVTELVQLQRRPIEIVRATYYGPVFTFANVLGLGNGYIPFAVGYSAKMGHTSIEGWEVNPVLDAVAVTDAVAGVEDPTTNTPNGTVFTDAITNVGAAVDNIAATVEEQQTKLGYITVTTPVDLDNIEAGDTGPGEIFAVFIGKQ